jgi:hypothetical protein
MTCTRCQRPTTFVDRIMGAKEFNRADFTRPRLVLCTSCRNPKPEPDPCPPPADSAVTPRRGSRTP